MAEALSLLPISPDSAIGTMVDNSPEEKIKNSNDEQSVNVVDGIPMPSENKDKDTEVSIFQESPNNTCQDNGSPSNNPIDHNDEILCVKLKMCDTLLVDTDSHTKIEELGMPYYEQANFLNDQKEELSQECCAASTITTVSTDLPLYSATLQVNDQGEVEETLLDPKQVINLINNQITSEVILDKVDNLNTDSSLSDFLSSCDADGNEAAGMEEVAKKASKNFAKFNCSSMQLSCSSSSLQVNPSIPEDLSEYSNNSDENISLIESEVESADESEIVLSASMQFSLNKLDSHDSAAIEDMVQNSSLSTTTIPIKHENKKQLVTEDDSEGDCILDFEEDPLELEESSSNFNTCNANHISEPLELPETVTKLSNEAGSEVYLVGTAHFSKESQEDVSKTIQMVRPDIIVLELCKARTAVLELDEETILRESKSLDFGKIRVILNQHGKVQGVLYILLLSVSAHITEQLKMAPGGEFREAIHEARRTVPGCMIQLGDRPIQVTLSRALASLSVWQKAKLMWHILSSKEPISKEEVEKCKKKDFIEEMLAEMTGQFPGISEVFVKERDVFLTRSLQMAADPTLYQNFTRCRNSANKSPRVVVGVVGIGHVAGITELWNKVTEDDINAILVIPPPNLSDQIFKWTLKCTFYGLIGFGIYKCLRPTARDSIHTFIGNSGTKISDYFSKYLSH